MTDDLARPAGTRPARPGTSGRRPVAGNGVVVAPQERRPSLQASLGDDLGPPVRTRLTVYLGDQFSTAPAIEQARRWEVRRLQVAE
jgi:hypothetical protein